LFESLILTPQGERDTKRAAQLIKGLDVNAMREETDNGLLHRVDNG